MFEFVEWCAYFAILDGQIQPGGAPLQTLTTADGEQINALPQPDPENYEVIRAMATLGG